MNGRVPVALAKTTLLSRIRRLLNDNPFTTACNEAMDAVETDIDVTATLKFDVGDIVEFQDDGEQCLVTALFSATVLTVIRGYNGTTAATHSTGVLLCKNPVFQFVQIEQAVDAVLRGLWPYVYKEVNYTLTPNTNGNQWYELDDGGDVASIMELSSVRQAITVPGGYDELFEYGTRRTYFPVTLHFNVPATIAGSGVALRIQVLRNNSESIFVNGLARITAALSSTNYADFSDGLEADCVMYLAAARLIAQTDISRVTQEDITMSDESVRPGSRTSVASYWEMKGMEMRKQWEIVLQRTLPRKWKRAGDGS
jgi:hypothetical protein